MPKITQNTLHAKMPIAQLHDRLRAFARPVTTLLPDVRLQEVAHLMLQGLVTAESPIITQIARGTSHHEPAIVSFYWCYSRRNSFVTSTGTGLPTPCPGYGCSVANSTWKAIATDCMFCCAALVPFGKPPQL